MDEEFERLVRNVDYDDASRDKKRHHNNNTNRYDENDDDYRRYDGSKKRGGGGRKRQKSGTVVNVNIPSSLINKSSSENDETNEEEGGEVVDENNVEECIPLSSLRSEFHKSHIKCWGCVCNFGANDGSVKTSPIVKKMWDYFAASCTTVSLSQIAQCLHEFHETLIRKPARERGFEEIEWSPQTAFIHITEHMRHPKIVLLNTIDALDTLTTTVANKCVKRRKNNEEIVDHEMIRTFTILLKTRESLRRSNPEDYRAFTTTSSYFIEQ